MEVQVQIHIQKLLAKNTRLDSRGLLDYRKPITIEYNISKSAEGSARVKIGDTEVLAGVKMEVGTPYPDTPDEGSIMVSAELTPLSNPNFESGPPSIESIELARVVDRAIRESKAIDLKKLCIRKSELMWMAVIDICPLNDAGNLFDAAALAAIAALKVTKMPALVDDKVDYKNITDEELPLEKIPISVTVSKIGDKFIVDPSYEEEPAIDARLTVATLEDGTLCALQKGGDAALTSEEIEKMVDIAIDKSKELRAALG